MPVYKDEVTNTWYCKLYYSTWDGKRKQTTKRGFKTKKAEHNAREGILTDLFENDTKSTYSLVHTCQ